MKKLLLPLLLAVAGGALAQNAPLQWGDQGNGTYINPIINADFSDPDVIRVDSMYYMVASDFHFMGMQVLESNDMVNWRYVAQIYDRFDEPGWDENAHYAGGSWAPAIRYHEGRFYVFFCTPDEGLFMSSAPKAEGPWQPLHLVKRVPKWEDPCPLWDNDGQAYLGRSRHGAGPIIVHKMSPDGKQLLDEGVTVYTGPVAEGTKWLKRDGYYYLIIPEGGVGQGWQTVLRSKNVYGPYEKKVVLESRDPPISTDRTRGRSSIHRRGSGGSTTSRRHRCWAVWCICSRLDGSKDGRSWGWISTATASANRSGCGLLPVRTRNRRF